MSKIILINGAPSAGKSTLAEKLQESLNDSYIYLNCDTFIDMLPKKNVSLNPNDGFQLICRQDKNQRPIVDLIIGNKGEAFLLGFIKCIEVYASLGFSIIADVILTKKEWEKIIDQHLTKYHLFKVLLWAPLKELERREQMTCELSGLARGRYDAIYKEAISYDLKIDTSKISTEEATKKILKMMHSA